MDGLAASLDHFATRELAVKATEVGGPHGYDGGKRINGRKRHLVVDTLGLLLAVTVTSAAADDGTAAPRVLAKLTRAAYPRLERLWAEAHDPESTAAARIQALTKLAPLRERLLATAGAEDIPAELAAFCAQVRAARSLSPGDNPL